MSKRKTAKDYRQELQEINQKKLRLRNQIAKRAEELVNANPDVVVGTINTLAGIVKVYGRDYKDSVKQMGIGVHLDLIEVIEEYLRAMHPHKQTTIEYPTVMAEPRKADPEDSDVQA